jgi:hypothetical protein
MAFMTIYDDGAGYLDKCYFPTLIHQVGKLVKDKYGYSVVSVISMEHNEKYPYLYQYPNLA